MMDAARTSETSVDNYFTRQYIPEDNSELLTSSYIILYSHDYDHSLNYTPAWNVFYTDWMNAFKTQ
jgi:hypothetical protein